MSVYKALKFDKLSLCKNANTARKITASKIHKLPRRVLQYIFKIIQ